MQPAIPVQAPCAFSRILVVLETWDRAEVAARQGVALARAHGAEVLFADVLDPYIRPNLNARQWPVLSGDGYALQFVAQSQRQHADAIAIARSADVTADAVSVAAPGDIARAAAEQACDLIVVASSGCTAWRRLLSGSIIPGLITAASVPVLVCRSEPASPECRGSHDPRKGDARRRSALAASADRAA